MPPSLSARECGREELPTTIRPAPRQERWWGGNVRYEPTAAEAGQSQDKMTGTLTTPVYGGQGDAKHGMRSRAQTTGMFPIPAGADDDVGNEW